MKILIIDQPIGFTDKARCSAYYGWQCGNVAMWQCLFLHFYCRIQDRCSMCMEGKVIVVKDYSCKKLVEDVDAENLFGKLHESPSYVGINLV